MRTDSCQLLERWYQANDPSALEGLLELHGDWLRRYVRRKLGNHLRVFQDSEDVVSDVLIEVLRYAPRFRPRDEGEFRGLLARMVLNRISRHNDRANAEKRSPAREQRLEDMAISRIGPAEASSARPDRRAEKAEERNLLRLARELIDPADQVILELRADQAHPFAQIADELELGIHAAKKRYARAVLRLGRQVEQLREGRIELLIEEIQADQRPGDHPCP